MSQKKGKQNCSLLRVSREKGKLVLR